MNQSKSLFLGRILVFTLIFSLQDCSAQYLPFGYYNSFGGGYPPYYNNYYGYGGYNNYYNYGLGGWGRAARTRRQDIPGIYCSHAKFCG